MPNITWYFFIIILIAYWIKNDNPNLFIAVSGIGITLFLLASTSSFPKTLIHSIEKKYTPIDLNQLDSTKTYYIHVLGAGSAVQSSLPATMSLSATTLTRLVEGIRIYLRLNNAVLVTSAAIEGEKISQARLTKDAAISLGVKKEAIEMLETPTSTLEEASAFKEKFGTNKNVILVTSALHMPRAVEIFSDTGIKVIPAPTDYLATTNGMICNKITFPSLASINLLNNYQTTLAKHMYYKWFKKSTQSKNLK